MKITLLYTGLFCLRSVALASLPVACTVNLVPHDAQQPQPIADGILQPNIQVPYRGTVAYLDIPSLGSANTTTPNISTLLQHSYTLNGAPAPAPAPDFLVTAQVLTGGPGEFSPTLRGSPRPTPEPTDVANDDHTNLQPSTGPGSPSTISTSPQQASFTSTPSATLDTQLGAPLNITDVLKAFNGYRATNHALPVKWSPDLAAYASKWTSACQFKHSQGPWGENLCLGFINWSDCIFAWYNEHLQYNYATPAFTASTGHFTQLSWLSTQLIGCASVSCPNLNGIFYACEFAPQGNVEGQFAQNVLAP